MEPIFFILLQLQKIENAKSKMRHYTLIIVHNLIIVSSLLIFFSCKASKINTSNDFTTVMKENEKVNENQPIIVFLNCSLVYDSIQNEYNMALINKIIVDGELKKSVDPEAHDKKDFRYSVLDKNAQLIFQKYLPSPLEQTVEYVDEWGSLRKKDIRLDKTQFSLRISLSSEARYISFDRHDQQLLLIDLKN